MDTTLPCGFEARCALLANNAGLTRLRLDAKEGRGLNAMKNEPRDRQRTLRVVVSATERERIRQRAQIAGMSVSSFLRTAALGSRVHQALDWEAVRMLAKINSDQGRLGGLLRMYLKDPDATGSIARALLDQIKSVQRDLAEAARKVK
jgi:hypothetical protein